VLRILRAFAWMRWRMLANSIEHTSSRDTLERFSLAMEKLGPILAAVLMVPSALFLAGLGAAAGFSLARGEAEAITIQISRYILLIVPLVVLAGPLMLPGSDRANPIRLLLLPIQRSTLYVAQCASAFGDPWHILSTPLILFFAVGLLAGGAPLAALMTLCGALLLIALLAGLGTLATSGLHLLFRDRRRGELVALLFIVFIPLVSMVPAFFADESRDPALPPRVEAAARAVMALMPPQLYMSAAENAAAGNRVRSVASLLGLAAWTVILHAIGFTLFRRVLDSPATWGSRRTGQMRAMWTRRLPGLSTAASAVALAHVRLALRTPRGRSVLLSPLILFAFFGFLMYRGSGTMDFGPFNFQSGVGLAAFTSFFCLMSVVPISMNQFAIDRAGLTLSLLSPLTETELLAGKAVGNGLIGLIPSLVCFAAALAIFPAGSPALWASIPLGLIAVYLVVAPVAAIASATFPKAVDLNTVGSNNAHGLAALMGMVSFVVAAAPPTLLALLAVAVLERPVLAPLLVAVWSLAAYVISRIVFIAARRIFQSRRENLATIASQ
jgi:hypothetical protein